MLGTHFLSGANSRLLPPSIPFRFFSGALVFYGLFWAGLFYAADDIPGYIIGSGPVLSTIHLATLGVLTMTVIGAALQLLSVATRRAFKAFWLCRLVSWIYIPGFILLSLGMFTSSHWAMMGGASLATLGLMIFFYLIIDNIRGVKGMAAIMAHCWVAMLSLCALVILGLMLIMDLEQGFLADHMAMASSHFILAVFGFMSILAMGFSYILVPMFALSPGPSEKIGRLSIAFNAAAVIMMVVALNSPLDWLAYLALASGFFGVGLYLKGMVGVYGARMKKRLGYPFLLIRAGWVMLLLTLVWGGIGLAGFWPETGAALFAFMAIVGWLLTFLVGVLQRILPFLSSMHTSGSGGIPMLASSMADERLLKLNALGHLAGFVVVATGIILDFALIIQIGAVIGFTGAAGLLIYLISIVRHMIKNQPGKM